MARGIWKRCSIPNHDGGVYQTYNEILPQTLIYMNSKTPQEYKFD